MHASIERPFGLRSVVAKCDDLPVTDPLTIHVWMPSGRSLCDRRAARRIPFEDDLITERAREEAAPACGACLTVASVIRGQAYLIYRRQPSVWPAPGTDSIDSLAETVWNGSIDEDLWDDRDWTSLEKAYSEEQTQEVLARMAEADDAHWEWLAQQADEDD